MSSTLSVSLPALFALAVLSLPLRADGLETWFVRNGPVTHQSRFTYENLLGVVHSGGRYVVWSEQGGIWSSTDGCSWEAAAGPAAVRSVACGNGLWLAVGESPLVWVSPDGVQWESRDSSPMVRATRVVHGDAGFIAHGARIDGMSGLFQSVDGVRWELRRNLDSVSTLAYAGGRYLAPVPAPSPSTVTSVLVGQMIDQSLSWRLNTINQPLELSGLAYGNGHYVAVGRHRDTQEARVAVTTDTQVWTVTGLPGLESRRLEGIAFANGQFVAVGDNGLMLGSSDGVAWVEGPSPVTEGLRAVAWGDNGWVAVGDGGVAYAVDWSIGVPSLNRHLHGAVHADGRYVVAGEDGTVGVSTNGQDWTVHSAGASKALLGVTHGANRYVAVGEQGTVVTSGDGVTWEPQASGSETWLSAVAHGNGQYVAVGDQGTILESVDGADWEPRASGTTNWLKDVVFAADQFVAVGGRSLLSSVDGVAWVAHAGLRDLEAVAYGSGLWVAVGGTEEGRKGGSAGMGVAYTSRDGEVWERHKLSSLPWLTDVAYVGGWFVAVVGGDIGGVLRSADGARWEVLPVGEVQGLNALCSDGETVVAVGDGGTIVQSGIIEPPGAGALADDPLDHWHARNPYPTHHNLERCVYGNGRFVALGSRFEKEHGALLNSETSILASLDGVHWERVFWDYRPVQLLGLAFGGNQFVAVGEQGLILTSVDGRTWREIDAGVVESLTDVAFGDGQYVAVSREGSVLSSVDGKEWLRRDLAPTGWRPWVAFGGGVFLIGTDSSGGLMRSTDGMTWSQTATNYTFSSLTFGPGGFAALGRRNPEGAWGLWRSSDGVNWTKTSVAGGLDTSWSRVWYQAGLYVASSWDLDRAFVSQDGEHWDMSDGDVPSPVNDLAYGAGHYVAVGWRGQVARSRDGSVWTSHAIGPSYALDKVAFGDGVFVAARQEGPGTIHSVDGGLTWIEAALPEGLCARDLASGGGRFVAVVAGVGGAEGGGSGIAVCEPGGPWTTVKELPFSLAGVAYGAGRFVAVGAQGAVLTSSDGREWQEESSGREEDLVGVGYGDPGFVALSSAGWVGLSPNGEGWTWTCQDGLEEQPPKAVAWGNDRFVAVATRTILVSADGQTWERYRSDAFDGMFDVAYGDGRFAVVGGCGTILSSADGRIWRLHATEVGMQLRGVAFGGGSFVLTGGASPSMFYPGWGSGLVLQSDPAAATAPVVHMWDRTREVVVGEPFTLAAAASGSPSLSYQWFHEDRPVAGATGSQFTVTGVTYSDAGSYFVEVTNAVGRARGGPVEVRISQPPQVELRVAGGLGLRVAPVMLVLEALVDDPDGDVVRVDFYLNDNLLGTDTSAPFGWESVELEPGVYRWRARAIDNAGVSSYSGLACVRIISPDPLVNWSIESSGFSGGVSSIAYVGGEYLACTWDAMSFSTNLSNWEVVRISTEQQVQLVTCGDGWYVAMANSTVNNQRNIWRSRDGRAWERASTTVVPANITMRAGMYGAGRFVMVGSGGDPQAGYVLYSTGPDATGWIVVSLPTLKYPNAIAYGGSRFVAVGQEGAIAWSVDGGQWNVCSSPTSTNLAAVTYGAGLFVAVGEGGTILTSNDGVTWSASISGTTARLNGVAYGGQAFAAVGENGTIFKSLDGVEWETCFGGEGRSWSVLTWAEGRFVAMGWGGGLMVRSDATTVLDPLRMTPDGRLACGFAGVAGRTYRLERSEDLIHWTELAAAAGVHGPMGLTDPELPTAPCRYYRVLWTP